MPCNRRNLNAHAFSFHADMFPAESLLAAFLEQASSSRAGEELHPVSSRGDSHPNKEVHNEESSQAHIVRMDVPGVKANRVTIEEQNGEVEITAVRMKGKEVAKVYQEVFYLNPYQFDFERIKATLTNGVLVVNIPKNKGQSNLSVEVESKPVPTDLDSNVFVHSLDLPGVPASSLEVQIVKDQVHLRGKRSLGDKRIRVQHSFDVPPSMITLQARALLQDGVFTFLAPIPPSSHDGGREFLRHILVQEGDEEDEEMEVEASVATMKISDDDSTNFAKKPVADEDMKQQDVDCNVETVNEEAEARKETDSWEEVCSDEDKWNDLLAFHVKESTISPSYACIHFRIYSNIQF